MTSTDPGTRERIRVYQRRHAAGLPLFDPRDQELGRERPAQRLKSARRRAEPKQGEWESIRIARVCKCHAPRSGHG
jgi:hypothetical protein